MTWTGPAPVLINPITRGDWNVVDLLHVEYQITQNMVYGCGKGREARVCISITCTLSTWTGTGPCSLLTPEEGHHEINFPGPEHGLFLDTLGATIPTPPKQRLSVI